jgi:phenylacetate-coenzyme A ligase PaaK-like adenylate-forming protein
MDVFDLACRRLIYPLWARREGRNSARLCRELDRRQSDSPAVIRARQCAALRRILRHAEDTVPYYRARFRRLGLSAEDVVELDDLSALPILTKSDIREQGAELLSTSFRGRALTRKKTSGSTGVPLEVKLDPSGLEWKRACTLRADEWCGWRRGQRVAKVWGNPEFKQNGLRGRIRNWLYERALYLDTLQMSPDAIARFAHTIATKRPEMIFGHAHSVFLLADHIERNYLPRYRPSGIITTAMVLHDWQRRRIEGVFQCPVTNRYGCEEVSLIACECSEHRGLHINSDSVFVETLRDGRPTRPGEPGAIVITDLSNFAMPLIRYQVGDVGVLSGRICSCGRGLPLLEAIEGREADYVVTADGQFVSGISLTENFAVLVPGIAQIQIVQESVECFLFRIVRDAAFGPASERAIAALVAERFGPGVRWRCEFVEAIPQEPSGKYRFCISHVPRTADASKGRAVA